jgi:hypothetical protein
MVRATEMNQETTNTACDHDWEYLDDQAAYNDGLSIPTVAICRKCHVSRKIKHEGGSCGLGVFFIPIALILMFVFVILTRS